MTVSTELRDADGKLPAVPAAHAICQQDAITILGTGAREKSSLYCNGASESLVYGRASGGLANTDLAYIFDFCPTGLRGGRDYVVFFSPIDTQQRFAECPYRCDSDAEGFIRYLFTSTLVIVNKLSVGNFLLVVHAGGIMESRGQIKTESCIRGLTNRKTCALALTRFQVKS